MLVGVYLTRKEGRKMGCSGLVFHLGFKPFALLCYVLYLTVPQPPPPKVVREIKIFLGFADIPRGDENPIF